MFRTLLFTVGEDDDLEHLAQEQEQWCNDDDRFQVSLMPQEYSDNVSSGSQARLQQSTTTDPIDGPTRSPIGTPSMTI
jgi:hypothetical protein